jgi:FG-GAP-like repeat
MITRRTLLVILTALTCACLGGVSQAANNPVPLLYQPMSPTAAAPGSAGLTLTVRGSGFVSGAVVNWNGSARTTTFVSGSEVTAAILSSDLATAGTATITVTNPAPGGGTSNGEYFEITNPTVGLAFQTSAVPAGTNYGGDPAITGDFNGDGKLDMAIRASSGNTIVLLLGDGDGTFQPPVSITAAPANAGDLRGIVAADMNGDGKLDLTVSYDGLNGGPGGVATILGNGDGTFQAPVASLVTAENSGCLPTTMVAADVNGDGNLDLVSTCAIGLRVDLGNGDGTFTAGFTFTSPVFTGGGARVTSVAVGDFNNDGKLDVAFAAVPQYLDVMLGNGDGTFAAPTVVYDFGPGAGVSSVAAADFDGDGNLDLAIYYYLSSAGQLSILRGNGDGTFQAPLTLAGLSNYSPYGIPPLLTGDFNGDGHVDIAVDSEIILIESLASPVNYKEVPIPGYWAVAGDFNGDGRLDLAGPVTSLTQLDVQLQVAPTGDFSGGVNPTYQTVVTGAAATYAVSTTAIDGFSGTITFNASGLPAGATANFAPGTVTGSGSTTLTISTTAGTPTGSYTVSLTGTSGSLTHSGTITLNVGASGTDFTDFAGSVQPAYRTIAPGASTFYDISSVPLNGFSSSVSLSVSGLPAGATAVFSPTVIPGGSGGSQLTITTLAGTPTASYPLTVTGTGGGHTHSTVVNLNVGPAGSQFQEITGAVTPSSQTVALGGSTTFTITVQSLNGYTGPVNFDVYGDPAYTEAALNPPIVSLTAGGTASSVLTVTPSAYATPGTYTLILESIPMHQGTTGETHLRSLTLTITP